MLISTLADIICCIAYFLKVNISNKKSTFNNESTYLFNKFTENPPIFMKLG